MVCLNDCWLSFTTLRSIKYKLRLVYSGKYKTGALGGVAP